MIRRRVCASICDKTWTSANSNPPDCVICYNDFGVPNPEGINEAPLRLPKCRHVFGDHCIKKWFEESDSCPYCRDKLQSEPAFHHPTYNSMILQWRRGDHRTLP